MRLNGNQHLKGQPSMTLGQRMLLLAEGICLLLTMLMALIQLPEYTNTGRAHVNARQTKYIGMHFTNTTTGIYTNEGEMYYQGHITNMGTMDCGGCSSGANYINNKKGERQHLRGSSPLTFYDLVLDNAGGLMLENELRVVNSLDFRNGMLLTDRANPAHFVHFLQGAIYSQATAGKHIDGYAAKTGDEPFVFPIGDGNELYMLGIEGSQPTDVFKAAYFGGDPASAGLPAGAPFDRSLHEPAILAVYERGYWDVDGAAATPLTLHWQPATKLDSLVDDLNELAVVGWDGSQWKNLGNLFTQGDLSTGYISSEPVVPDAYQAYTFARSAGSLLSANWLEFTAELVQNDGLLTWHTGSEEDVAYYQVQRSVDARMFDAIHEQPASRDRQSQHTYTFTDLNVTAITDPYVYYRIKQVDLDGQFSFSQVERLKLRKHPPQLQLVLYPNPARELVNIRIRTHTPESAELVVYNMLGQLVTSRRVNIPAELSLDVSSWAEGTYQLVIQGRNLTANKQLVVH